MIIKVENKKLEIIEEEIINAGDYNVDICEFEFINEEYKNLFKVAVFCKNEHLYKRELENNRCIIPYKTLKNDGFLYIGLYLYSKENNILKLRYSFTPIEVVINKGSYTDNECEENNFPDLSKFLKQDNIWQGKNIRLEYLGNNNIIINSESISEEDVNSILEDYYNKEETNLLLGDYYNKEETNLLLGDYYNKEETNSLLENKANKTEETQLIGWTSITSNEYQELDLNPYLDQNKHRFTILVYVRKSNNRQAIKFELTISELNKLISKGLQSISNTLVITRSCMGISNVNKNALCKQTLKRTETDGIIQLKYEIYEDGVLQSSFDNFEFCMYAE